MLPKQTGQGLHCQSANRS